MARFDFIAAYILANRKNGAIYTGSTSDLITRIDQHKLGAVSEFSTQYCCQKLVWFEPFEQMTDATHKERRLKTWSRAWKVALIEETNPHWDDLSLKPF